MCSAFLYYKFQDVCHTLWEQAIFPMTSLSTSWAYKGGHRIFCEGRTLGSVWGDECMFDGAHQAGPLVSGLLSAGKCCVSRGACESPASQ